MRLIAANGASFLEGANDTATALDEGPAMRVSFTYDFYLDTTEVTQDEYFSITNRKPVASGSRYGVGGSLPVYNVSWFDAALYCNEKSKKNGYDTVYSYNQVQADSTTGSVYNLVGLRINYPQAGYRLPTEAEWEFAAQGGSAGGPSDSSTAWYAANSNGQSHAVATKTPNGLGLYDMAGNVYEWTNDWKCPHYAVPITNPIGAETANSDFERVVKGGGFINDAKSLWPQCRSTTYPTAASTATYYVGFRCAFGPVSRPLFVTGDSLQANLTNPVDLVVASIIGYTRVMNTRLVFINVTGESRALCYVNYAEARPQVHEFRDRLDVYTPTISPDGRFVAFSTSEEGMRLVSSATIFVRSLDSTNSPLVPLPAPLGFVPRWWVDPSTSDTFVVYTNSGMDCDLTDWASTQTLKQKMSNGRPIGDPITIVANGSFHDGLSPDGHYIVTGTSKLKMKNMVTGEVRQLFVCPNNGKPANGSTQVCNVSMCPDSTYTGTCMFLDFGSSDISTITKTSYEPHEYLFFSNFSGQTIKLIKSPGTERTWENPEWSNQWNFAVSAAGDQDGNQKSIYLIKIDLGTNDATYRLISGEHLANPYLWISQKLSTASDSAARYDLPPIAASQEMIADKLAGFWKYRDSMEIVFAGTSHTEDGIAPEMIASGKAFNLGIGATQLYEGLSIINDYIIPNCKHCKLIGMDLIPGMLFFPKPDSAKSPLYSNAGFAYDKSHDFWKDSIPAEFLRAVDNLPLPQDLYAKLTTCELTSCNGWGGPNPDLFLIGPDSAGIDSPDFIRNWADFEKTADTCANRKIHFLVYITPESPYFAATPFYGRGGPLREVARSIIAQCHSLEQSNPYFHFYDANLEENHDYADAEATDPSHLCSAGAHKLSMRLDSVVTVILHKY